MIKFLSFSGCSPRVGDSRPCVGVRARDDATAHGDHRRQSHQDQPGVKAADQSRALQGTSLLIKIVHEIKTQLTFLKGCSNHDDLLQAHDRG